MAMLAEDGGSHYSDEKATKKSEPLEDFSHISVFNSPVLSI